MHRRNAKKQNKKGAVKKPLQKPIVELRHERGPRRKKNG